MTVYQKPLSSESSVMKEIAFIATFTSLVFLSTSIFYIPLVSSTGFFNLGEAFVYIAALVGGPIVGGFAGGIGSAMADMVLGYGTFAPATLVLKGLEGFVVGFIYHKSQKIGPYLKYIILGIISLFLIGFSIFVTTPSLNGFTETNIVEINLRVLDINLILDHIFDPAIEDAYQTLVFSFPGVLIVSLVLILVGIMWIIELRMGEKGQMILVCLLAGPIIIIGYFIYEISVIGVALAAALTEVPFNIAQVAFGAAIAASVIFSLRELGIIKESDQS